MSLFGTNVEKTHELHWYRLLLTLQWTKTTLVSSRYGTFLTFLPLVIFSSVLTSNFLVSGVNSSG